jgi:hypothetical protein
MHPPKMGGKQENAGHQQQDLTGKFLGSWLRKAPLPSMKITPGVGCFGSSGLAPERRRCVKMGAAN